MSGRLHDEVAELLGVYALHALDADEAALVEAHLEDCPRCRAELRDHEHVAAQLGNSGGSAPSGLWDRIATTLEETPPPMRLDLPAGEGTVLPLIPRRERAGRVGRRAVVPLAAAAAALVIAVLGAQVLRQDDRIDQIESASASEAIMRAASLALTNPDATQVDLTSLDGSIRVPAVLQPDGTGYVMADQLPDLGPDRTYQLWGQTSGGLVSLGLLGEDPTVVPFHASGELAALAITEEEAGGVVQSRNAPAVAGTFD